MLKLAIKAVLPIIACYTRDVLNMPDVVKHLSGKEPRPLAMPVSSLGKHKLYYMIMTKPVDISPLYAKLVELESSLLVINPTKLDDFMFNAGEIPIPKELVIDFLNQVVDDKPKAVSLQAALGGVTIKEVAELAKLTMARDDSLTAKGLMQTRKQFFQGSNGLTQVDTAQLLYVPHEELVEYIVTEKDFFLNCKDHRLIPRGLLFDGQPGVGKSAGAKFLAEQWGVPLYRFDISSTKSKYVGDSEANMLANLNRIDQEEPCCVLFDEVEKVFGGVGENDSNTTTSMMSQLLWWLAEHRSRVFTIMTTNAAKKLPKELYREGRIDKSMWFPGLDGSAATDFVDALFHTFPGKWNYSAAKIVKSATSIKADGSGTSTTSHAAITKAVYSWIKSNTEIK